jgi:hypothetical protein
MTIEWQITSKIDREKEEFDKFEQVDNDRMKNADREISITVPRGKKPSRDNGIDICPFQNILFERKNGRGEEL